jgi:large conductance mechanosensitive channel
MAFFADFKKFALKGNITDLAIGVIIGAAFGKIISSLVDDVIMPLINPLIPGGKWQSLVIGPGIRVGNFLSAILNFAIIAFALFLVFKAIDSFRKHDNTPPPAPTSTDKLLMEIRDELKVQKQ